LIGVVSFALFCLYPLNEAKMAQIAANEGAARGAGEMVRWRQAPVERSAGRKGSQGREAWISFKRARVCLRAAKAEPATLRS